MGQHSDYGGNNYAVDTDKLKTFLYEEGPHTIDEIMKELGWTRYRTQQTLSMLREVGDCTTMSRSVNNGLRFVRVVYHRYVEPEEHALPKKVGVSR